MLWYVLQLLVANKREPGIPGSLFAGHKYNQHDYIMQNVKQLTAHPAHKVHQLL
ncbi:Uncharacterised protein [Legionella busanensis]|uniref:Uncharacterized protein n=1 Tax=Legionella busanensis TaxID=190655 RepID=A0A378KIA3_9GAMM|nr:Uncharacterised protein [Legionella busanensis]